MCVFEREETIMGEDNELGPDGRPIQIFTPGIAGPPPHLAGRSSALDKLRRAVTKMKATKGGGQPILLFGPRGMGKTVLLEEFENDPEPMHGADVRYIVPSTALTDINNIPRMLLSDRGVWKNWREMVKAFRGKMPGKANLKIPGFADIEFDLKGSMDKIDYVEYTKNEIIRRCAEHPMVLIVDEAHTLTKETGAFFLNYIQGILKNGSRLLLVLAGTPNLRSHLMSIGASFISRGGNMPLGLLSDKGAKDSIKIPLQEQDREVSIDDGVLDRVVKDSMGYPFFLQMWGEQLWEARLNTSSMDAIGNAAFDVAKEIVREKKLDHYSGYINEIFSHGYLDAAAAIAEAFAGGEEIKSAKAFAAIFRTLDDSLSRNDRFMKSWVIMEHLKAKDVLWEPRGGISKPALPSFHSQIKIWHRELESELPDAMSKNDAGTGRYDPEYGVDASDVLSSERSMDHDVDGECGGDISSDREAGG